MAVQNLNLGRVLGSQWNTGTALVHTTGTATTATGIAYSMVGDMYLNSETGNVYRCTTAGASGTAVWTYEGNIKGATGETGETGETGDTGPAGADGSKTFHTEALSDATGNVPSTTTGFDAGALAVDFGSTDTSLTQFGLRRSAVFDGTAWSPSDSFVTDQTATITSLPESAWMENAVNEFLTSDHSVPARLWRSGNVCRLVFRAIDAVKLKCVVNQNIFWIPSGFRPRYGYLTYASVGTSNTNDGLCGIYIDSSGAVRIYFPTINFTGEVVATELWFDAVYLV